MFFVFDYLIARYRNRSQDYVEAVELYTLATPIRGRKQGVKHVTHVRESEKPPLVDAVPSFAHTELLTICHLS